MNYLFILADQWRHTDLSCANHSVVRTPNIDKLASMGVRFENMVVQSPVCGPSRLCYFTGRYMHSHRSQWNGVQLPADEIGIGHIMKDAGYNAMLCGKGSGAVGECGLDDVEKVLLKTNYKEYLLNNGYKSENPIDDFAMSVQLPNGQIKTCWDFAACPYPLRVVAKDSPPAYITSSVIEAIKQQNSPWIMHLSYVWPHWPLGCSAPYNSMYSPDDVPFPIRSKDELMGPRVHPLLRPFREERRSLPFDNEWVWRHGRACYYGMISEVDAQLGRLFEFLEETDKMDDTMIIFTSDHGEYLGDHWMFEKELFYDQAVRVPLIVYNPDSKYDKTRGRLRKEFVESVDILPTILHSAGISILPGVQGRSLLPLLENESTDISWRDHAVCEWDYEFYHIREKINVHPSRCYGIMIMDERFKYIHYLDIPCQLFDRINDPNELHDLSYDANYKHIINEYREKLLNWKLEKEDRTYSGAFYKKFGMIGVTLESDKNANYGVWHQNYKKGCNRDGESESIT